MGLDWLASNRVSDGAPPQAVIGCKRFNRNDHGSVDWLLNEHFKGYVWKPDLSVPELAGIIKLLEQPSTMSDVARLAKLIGVEFQVSEDRDLEDEERDAAAEWLFAAAGIKFFNDKQNFDLYAAWQNIAHAQLRIWMFDWKRSFMLHTAKEAMPNVSSGSFFATAASFRGDVLHDVSLPGHIAERIYDDLSPAEAIELAGEFKNAIQLKSTGLRNTACREPYASAEVEAHMTAYWPKGSKQAVDAETVIQIAKDIQTLADAAEWLLFWGSRDCGLVTWY